MLALVTGAATGIGFATARSLAAAGWTVLGGRLPGQPVEETPGIEYVDLDVTDASAVAAVARRIAERAEGLQLVVASAGLSLPGPLELRAEHGVGRELEVNAIAAIHVISAVLPSLRLANGRVVVIGAGQGRVALPFGGGYAASKAALAALTDSLRAEVGVDGITVSLIEPGAIRTDILAESRTQADAVFAGASPELSERYATRTRATLDTAARAFERALPPERIADLVLRIASAKRPKPRYLVGREAWALAVVALLPARARARIVARL